MLTKEKFQLKGSNIRHNVITVNKNTLRSVNSRILCQKDHDLDKCENFMKKSIEDRNKKLTKNFFVMGAMC